MKLSTEVVTTPTLDVTPELEQQLHSTISQIVGLQQQIDLLQELQDAEYDQLLATCDEAGIKSTFTSGAYINVRRDTSSSFSKKKLMAAFNITPAQIEMCTTRKPKRPYVTVETEEQRQAKAAKRAARKSAGEEDEDD